MTNAANSGVSIEFSLGSIAASRRTAAGFSYVEVAFSPMVPEMRDNQETGLVVHFDGVRITWRTENNDAEQTRSDGKPTYHAVTNGVARGTDAALRNALAAAGLPLDALSATRPDGTTIAPTFTATGVAWQDSTTNQAAAILSHGVSSIQGQDLIFAAAVQPDGQFLLVRNMTEAATAIGPCGFELPGASPSPAPGHAFRR